MKIINGHHTTDRDAQLSEYVFGKVPPQAITLEEAVLGAIMVDKDAIHVIAEILHPEMFYSSTHALIYDAQLWLYANNKPIDMLTVIERLRTTDDLKDIGGPAYIASLTNKVASAANIEYHARIIYQKFIRREIIRISTGLTRDSFDETVDDFDLLENAERSLFELTGDLHGQGISDSKHISGLLIKAKDKILSLPEGEIIGIPSGLLSIDKFTGGFQEPDFGIIAARPGMGKSAIITSFARQQAVFRGIPVGIFSLEMSAEQQQRRIAAAEADIPNSVCQDPRQMNPYQLQSYTQALERIAESPIYYCDEPGITVMQLKSKVREMVRKYGVKIIYIDYLQLMTGGDDKGNREQEISNISRGIKALAKEMKIPIIALSQLSRAVEIRGGSKRPQLSDLRESGSLEQDADWVAFLYRAEYYGILESPEGYSLKGVCEYIIAKNRNGKLGPIEIEFVESRVLFRDKDSFIKEIATENPLPAQQNSVLIERPKMNDDEDVPF